MVGSGESPVLSPFPCVLACLHPLNISLVSYKDANPIVEAPFSWPHHLPQSQPPKTPSWGRFGFNICILGDIGSVAQTLRACTNTCRFKWLLVSSLGVRAGFVGCTPGLEAGLCPSSGLGRWPAVWVLVSSWKHLRGPLCRTHTVVSGMEWVFNKRCCLPLFPSARRAGKMQRPCRIACELF